jgi:hypothetical protein
MARPKGYDSQKRYSRVIWSLIPSERPGARWTDIFREAHRLTGMSRSTFFNYFRKLPTLKNGDLYIRDPKIEEILVPKDAPLDKIKELRERLVASITSDPWQRNVSEDWRGMIENLLLHAVIMYIAGLAVMMEANEKAQARELFEWRMRFGIEPWLSEAAAIA